MDVTDLGPAERFVAGAVGRPGRRTFYLEVVAGGTPHWYVAEKEQVRALAEQALELIQDADLEIDIDAAARIAEALELDEPGEPEFRVGTMTLRAREDRELVTVELRDSADDDRRVTFQVAPEQLQALALKAFEAVAAGRQICDLCGLPMDPDGHDCPASNGHRKRA